MKLQIMSDLHLEMHRDDGRQFIESLVPRAPVLVLAGDITTIRDYAGLERIFQPLAKKFEAVLYVAGNHEFYTQSPKKVLPVLERLREGFPNVTVLDCSSVTIGGQRFVGGSMWFRERPKNQLYKQAMNDFHLIKDFEPWVYEQNVRFELYASEVLRSEDVVITHHLPAPESLGFQYRGSPLNCFFLHDMSALIEEVQPRLWIHGHTHVRCDYRLGKTRVVANPHGYPNEPDSLAAFDSNFVVEV